VIQGALDGLLEFWIGSFRRIGRTLNIVWMLHFWPPALESALHTATISTDKDI
jgi:hypothetical protein